MRRAMAATVFALIPLAAIVAGQAPAARQADASAVSRSGLLPIYGIDFNVDPAWVDASSFPGAAPGFPHQGVSALFQQTWEALRPGGFGVVRVAVDVRDPERAARQIANLCLWSQANGVRILPVLLAADRGSAPDKGFPVMAGSFVKVLLGLLRQGGGARLSLYGQIVAYQVEDQLNHVGLRQPFFPQDVPPLLTRVAAEIRRNERAALDGPEYLATPIAANFSFDVELAINQTIAGNPVSEDGLAKTYAAFKARYLTAVSGLADIDVIDIQWLAGSLGGGGPEMFASLLQRLLADLPGKQVLLTTGCSTAFRSAEDQAVYIATSVANVASFRASAGADSPFLGLMLRDALSRPDDGIAIARDTSRWDWREKSFEVVQTWNNKRPSEDARWWLNRVEGHLGLVSIGTNASGGLVVTSSSAQQGLERIASVVGESAATAGATPEVAAAPPPSYPAPAPPATAQAVPPVPDPGSPPPPVETYPPAGSAGASAVAALKEKGQREMMSLLDRVFERLNDKVGRSSSSGAGGATSGSPSPGGDAGAASSGPGLSAGTAPAITLSRTDVRLSPAAPRVGAPATFTVTLHNAAPVDARGLVLALVDDADYLLGPDTQLTDVAVPAMGSQDYPIAWTPAEAGTRSANVRVLDASLTSQYAALALAPILVAGAGAPGVPAAESPGSGGSASGTLPRGVLRVTPAMRAVTVAGAMTPIGLPHVRSLDVSPSAAGAGASLVTVTTSLVNPYSRTLADVTATLVVDGRTVATQRIGTLLPRQNRALLFPSVAMPGAGTREVKILLQSRGAKPTSGSYAKLVQLRPAPQPTGAQAAPKAAPAVLKPLPRVRPLVATPVSPPKR